MSANTQAPNKDSSTRVIASASKPVSNETLIGMPIIFVQVPENLLASLNIPSLESFGLLMQPAFISATVGFAVIASAETLLCATATDRMSRRSKTDYDKELIAQGVGNSLAGVLGALPLTGVIVRSTANVEAGATTRWSAVAHGAWLLALVVALPVVLTSIPTAALAAILVFTGYKLANPAQVKTQLEAGRGEALVFGVTVVGIVSTNLLIGVVVGLAFAVLKVLVTVVNVDVDVDEDGDREPVDRGHHDALEDRGGRVGRSRRGHREPPRVGGAARGRLARRAASPERLMGDGR